MHLHNYNRIKSQKKMRSLLSIYLLEEITYKKKILKDIGEIKE